MVIQSHTAIGECLRKRALIALREALKHWSPFALVLLYLLFQMTVSEIPSVGVPSIAIAK